MQTCFSGICLQLALFIHLLQVGLHGSYLALHLTQTRLQLRDLLCCLLLSILPMLCSCEHHLLYASGQAGL